MKTVAQITASFKKLLKNRSFAPPIEGKSLWIADAASIEKVPIKAFMSKAGNLYYRLNSPKKSEQLFVSLGSHYDELTSFEDGDIVMADVCARTPNPDITDADLQSMVDSPTLAGFTQEHANRHKEAMENDYASLVALSYDEPE